MRYTKQTTVSGNWVKAAELKSGIRAKLVSETQPMPSSFQDKDCSPKTQDVAKIRFEGMNETYNVSINRATLNALIEAFGEDSKEWINKYLTAQTEKMIVGGKRVTALYLIPEGFELKEDDGGYMVIARKSTETKYSVVETPESIEDINPDDIPF
jgi:hypothetical protein